MKLCIATQNQGKFKEFVYLAERYASHLDLCSLSDFVSEKGAVPEVIESGHDFYQNALIKAQAYAEYTGMLCLSDDSGLVVPALDCEPGLFSARYAGEGATDAQNNEKLMQEISLRQLLQPEARFECCLVVYNPESKRELASSTGALQGEILSKALGDQGFGYNPLFWVKEKNKTLAQLSMQEKLDLDHRSKAFQNLVKKLKP